MPWGTSCLQSDTIKVRPFCPGSPSRPFLVPGELYLAFSFPGSPLNLEFTQCFTCGCQGSTSLLLIAHHEISIVFNIALRLDLTSTVADNVSLLRAVGLSILKACFCHREECLYYCLSVGVRDSVPLLSEKQACSVSGHWACVVVPGVLMSSLLVWNVPPERTEVMVIRGRVFSVCHACDTASALLVGAVENGSSRPLFCSCLEQFLQRQIRRQGMGMIDAARLSLPERNQHPSLGAGERRGSLLAAPAFHHTERFLLRFIRFSWINVSPFAVCLEDSFHRLSIVVFKYNFLQLRYFRVGEGPQRSSQHHSEVFLFYIILENVMNSILRKNYTLFHFSFCFGHFNYNTIGILLWSSLQLDRQINLELFFRSLEVFQMLLCQLLAGVSLMVHKGFLVSIIFS